jgi:hypothetical protein
MAKNLSNRKRRTLWSQSGPSPRLVFGAAIIAIVGVLGMTPKEFFGIPLAWPFAALWGAMGWGRVGLSLRPMILLVIFGVMQDIVSNAPLGCFALINLLVYGMSAGIAEQTDGMRDTLVAFAGPVVLLSAAFLLVWGFASITSDHIVRTWPLLTSFITTGLVYAFANRMYDLGRRPGESPGGNG